MHFMKATFANRTDKPKSKSRKLEIEKNSDLYQTCLKHNDYFKQFLDFNTKKHL